MLNKDEYNQEEYAEYYRQETEGVRVRNEEKQSRSLIGKLLILLILLALAIAGYFGYKAMKSNNSTTEEDIDKSLKVSIEPSLPKSVQETTQDTPKESEETTLQNKESVEEKVPEIEVIKTKKVKTPKIEVVETKKAETPQPTQSEPTSPQQTEVQQTKVVQVQKNNSVETVESAVTSEVTKAVSNEKKISPKEIATIVAAVMKQMKENKKSEQSAKVVEVVDEKENSLLIDELSNSEVDSVSADLTQPSKSVEISESTKVDHSQKQIDVYNKVSVEGVSGSDSLSQLAMQINQEIINNPQISSTTTTTNEEDKEYSNKIKKEVVVRQKEMRIIVVRKGDTLGKIAKRAYGDAMEYRRIYEANPEVTNPNRIYIGQKLRIPN
jgi:nucleoid-associated protein YgaU